MHVHTNTGRDIEIFDLQGLIPEIQDKRDPEFHQACLQAAGAQLAYIVSPLPTPGPLIESIDDNPCNLVVESL
jgi:hypothetical protein